MKDLISAYREAVAKDTYYLEKKADFSGRFGKAGETPKAEWKVTAGCHLSATELMLAGAVLSAALLGLSLSFPRKKKKSR